MNLKTLYNTYYIISIGCTIKIKKDADLDLSPSFRYILFIITDILSELIKKVSIQIRQDIQNINMSWIENIKEILTSFSSLTIIKSD